MNFLIVKKYVFLLFIVVLLFAGFIYLEQNNIKYSLNVNKSQAISDQTIQILNSIETDKPLKFEIYSNKNTLVAKQIFKFFAPYKRINDNLVFEFIDPIENPTKVKNNGISMQGEILLTNTENKPVHITELSESAIANAILRFQNNKDEWILFAQGYGMQQVDNEKQQGLSLLLIQLKKMGYQIARMPLDKSLVLPVNVKLIILPAPTETINAGVVDWLQTQLNQGISLWWLTDVGIDQQMPLELMTEVLSGEKKPIKDEKFSDYLLGFPQHSITEKFNQPIYLAEARELVPQNPEISSVLLKSQDKSPLAVTEELQKSRIVVTGDYDFISNQYLNAAANKSFTVRIIDWLLRHDDRVNMAIKVNSNTQLLLTQTQLLVLSVIFLILIPMLFLIIAIKQWRAARG